MDRKKKIYGKYRNIMRLMLLILVTGLVLSLLGDLTAWLVSRQGGISILLKNGTNIGIIGGSDGPTAIFVTSAITSVLQIILKILLLSGSCMGWYCLRHRK